MRSTFRVDGAGRLSGVSGLLSSNFEFVPASGTTIEQVNQVMRSSIPLVESCRIEIVELEAEF